jgi:hypothetical protein
VKIEPLPHPGEGHGDDDGRAVVNQPDVGHEGLVEDGVDDGPAVVAAGGEAPHGGAVGDQGLAVCRHIVRSAV